MSLDQYLYDLDGDLYHPTERVISPWSSAQQSGIAVAGLLAYAVERVEPPGPMLLARLTIDIVRAVPVRPATVDCTVTRDGRRLQNLDVAMAVDGVLIARASALRVRIGENTMAPMPAPAHTDPETAPRRAYRRPDGRPSPFETRLIHGGDGVDDTGLCWARPAVTMLPEAKISPLVAGVMCADLGGGIASRLPRSHWTFANLDLAVNFARAPTSDWILVDSRTYSLGNGVGQSMAMLADLDGVFGSSRQTQFIAPAGRRD